MGIGVDQRQVGGELERDGDPLDAERVGEELHRVPHDAVQIGRAVLRGLLAGFPPASVRAFFEGRGLRKEIRSFEESTHNSELAAQSLGVEVGQIAKTILLIVDDSPVIVVISGDRRVDFKKEARALLARVAFDPERDAVLARIFGCDLSRAPGILTDFLQKLGVKTEFGAYGVSNDDSERMVRYALEGVRGKNFIGASPSPRPLPREGEKA